MVPPTGVQLRRHFLKLLLSSHLIQHFEPTSIFTQETERLSKVSLKKPLSNDSRRTSLFRYAQVLATEDNRNSLNKTEGDINIEFTITRSIEHCGTALVYTTIMIDLGGLGGNKDAEGTAFDYEIIACNSKRCKSSSPGTRSSL